MTEAKVRIEKLQLRLVGIDETTARALADDLGNTIGASVGTAALAGPGAARMDRVRLGSIRAGPGATPETLRAQVASAVGRALSVAKQSGSGCAA